MSKRSRTKTSKWLLPGFLLLAGTVYFLASWSGGNLVLGAVMFAILTAYAALLLLGGRVEFLRALRGQAEDERYQSFDLRATAYAGGVTVLVLLGCFVYELAQGKDGQPYALLGAIFGVSYIASMIWLRWRS